MGGLPPEYLVGWFGFSKDPLGISRSPKLRSVPDSHDPIVEPEPY